MHHMLQMLFYAKFWLQIQRENTWIVKMASSPPESWPSYSGKQLSLVHIGPHVDDAKYHVWTQKYNVIKVLWGWREEKNSLVQWNTVTWVAVFLSFLLVLSTVPSLGMVFVFEMSRISDQTPRKFGTFCNKGLQRVEAERVNASAKKRKERICIIYYLPVFHCSSLTDKAQGPQQRIECVEKEMKLEQGLFWAPFSF